MCKFKTLGVSWPPQGWQEFEMIDQSYGQSILKNPVSAIVSGMSYAVEPLPIFDENNQRTYAYAIRIDGWEYNIYNESSEYSILSFVIQDRAEAARAKGVYVSDMKTQAQSLPKTERAGHRIFMTALFMMKQIEKGNVPDFERVLRLYKVHPTQRSLYGEQDYCPQNSLFCGLKISSNDSICGSKA